MSSVVSRFVEGTKNGTSDVIAHVSRGQNRVAGFEVDNAFCFHGSTLALEM